MYKTIKKLDGVKYVIFTTTFNTCLKVKFTGFITFY